MKKIGTHIISCLLVVGLSCTFSSAAFASSEGKNSFSSNETAVSENTDNGVALLDAFKDENFRQYVKNDLGLDADNDGIVTTQELESVTVIDVTGSRDGQVSVVDGPIYSLEGIEYFPNLYSLKASHQYLSKIDTSKNPRLNDITITGNDLEAIDISANTQLGALIIPGNKISTLDVSKNLNLGMLWVAVNELKTLDLSKNVNLGSLWISSNQFTSIDVSNNLQLTGLWADDNKITQLDLSNNAELAVLSVLRNNLASLDISNNTKVYETNLAEQTLDNKVLQTPESVDGIYTLDIKALLNGGDIRKVSFTDNRLNYDANTGILSFSDKNIINTKITYLYDVGHDDGKNQQLGVSFNVYEASENVSMDVFKNANFKWYAKNKLGLDKDNDGYATQEELDAVTSIDVSYDVFPHYVSSLEGIEYFKNLETLAARKQPYTTLNLESNTKLKNLDVSRSALGALDVTKNTELEVLKAQYINIYSLNLANNTKLKTTELNQSLYNKQNQTTYRDGGYHFKLYGTIEKDNLDNVSFSDNRIGYDVSNGDISFTDTAILNNIITYTYNTGNSNAPMQVELYVYGQDISMDVFKDDNFRWYAKNKLNLDRDNDGIATSRELLAVKNIDVSYDVFPHYVTSLEGIEYFDNLETLAARRQPYTSLNVYGNEHLKSLDVSKSALGSLNLTNNTELEVLNTQYAGLSYINLDNNTKLNKFSLEQGWYKQNLQTPTLADGTYTLNLKPILGNANYANILFMDSRVKYDANLGILTFTDASVLNTDITYQYQTGHPNIIMNITLHIYK